MSSIGINRACESCRSSKVRCQPAPDGTLAAQQGRCQRCAAAGKACTFTPARRTKRKRTDVRVRELERELKALGDLLRAGNAGLAPENQQGLPDHQVADLSDTETGYPEGQEKGRPGISHATHGPSRGGSAASSHSSSRVPDPIDAGILSMESASRLFDRYVSDLAPQRPLVVFPPGTRASQIHRDKPTLFLAVVLVASSGTSDATLCTKLNDLLLQSYAKRIVILGEKSLELIQAILVSTNWHCQSGHYDHMKFYQQLHMAATMAVDIDLGEPRMWAAGDGMDEAATQSQAIERQRTLLGCYICCSSLSLNYHRPNMFPFTPQMEDCLEALETSPFASPSDAALASWARLQHIVDISDAALDLRGHSAKVRLSDAGVQLSLLNCTKQLESWRERTPAAVINEPLLMQYHAVYCLLHQICLYAEYNPADFKPPYIISIPSANTGEAAEPMLTPAHLSSVTKCISSAQAVVDTFLSMPPTTLACGSVVVYARMGYAIVILMKIHASAALPGGALNGVVDPGATKMGEYLDRVVGHLAEVSKYQCRLATEAWLPIMSQLREWYRRHLVPGAKDDDDDDAPGIVELIQPLRLVNLAADVGSRSQAADSLSANGVQDGRITLAHPGSSGIALAPDELEAPDSNNFFADHRFSHFGSFPGGSDYDMFSGMVPGDLHEWIAASAEFPEMNSEIMAAGENPTA